MISQIKVSSVCILDGDLSLDTWNHRVRLYYKKNFLAPCSLTGREYGHFTTECYGEHLTLKAGRIG